MILYPEFAGTLNKIYVKEGQKVKKGQLLATIDDGGLSQQVNQLEIQKNLSKQLSKDKNAYGKTIK